GDGLHCRPVETNPLRRPELRPFDSHNTLVYDDEARRYVIYLRGIDPSVKGVFAGGRRAIRRSESADFLHWSNPELVFTADAQDPTDFHIYTNAAVKYDPAARGFLIFPMIPYQGRRQPGAPHTGGSPLQLPSQPH